MLRIKVLSVGKNKEPWLELAISEYAKRLTGTASLEFIWAKNDIQLTELAGKEPAAIGLDPGGKQLDSTQFSSYLMRKLEEGGSRLAFIIGGAEGLPQVLKANLPLISLSPLVFTHQLCRLVLIEQIYRAFEIQKGSQYHK